MDCSTSLGNEGCGGGYIDTSFEYVKGKGLNIENGYPFEGKDGECRYKTEAKEAECTGKYFNRRKKLKFISCIRSSIVLFKFPSWNTRFV